MCDYFHVWVWLFYMEEGSHSYRGERELLSVLGLSWDLLSLALSSAWAGLGLGIYDWALVELVLGGLKPSSAFCWARFTSALIHSNTHSYFQIFLDVFKFCAQGCWLTPNFLCLTRQNLKRQSVKAFLGFWAFLELSCKFRANSI